MKLIKSIINYSLPLVFAKSKIKRARSLAYFFLSLISFGIYGLVASICNLSFKEDAESNIGYIKE